MAKKIFVIDDNLDIRNQLTAELQKSDCSVDFINAENVSEQIDQLAPDIILLDYQYSDAVAIAELINDKSIPYIITGTPITDEALNFIYQHGASGLLLKPIETRKLIIEIETASHWHWEKTQFNRRKENLNTTINNNRKISTAVGLVMEHYQIASHDAFEVLRRSARNKRRRLVDIADKMIGLHDNALPAHLLNSSLPDLKSKHLKDTYLAEVLNKIQHIIN